MMMEKRILMIGHVDLSKDDAPKVHFSNLARAFREHGLNVSCILYTPKEKEFESIGKNITVRFSPNPLFGNVLIRAIKYILVIPFIIWEFLRFKPQIVYFRFSPPVSLYLFIIMGFKALPFTFKVIIEFNDWVGDQRAIQGESQFKVSIIKFLQVMAARFTDYIRVVSEGIKDKLLNYRVVREKIEVIGNGTEVDFLMPMNKEEAKKLIGVNSNYFYVGFIGNFAIWQGLSYLTLAIPFILKENKKIRFLFVGDGPEMSKIKKEISPYKKEDIILTGQVSYKKINNYINAFDIGVAPFIKRRNDEIGLSPLKIRDYAACGVPIVSSRIRGLEMIEEEGIGILIPPEDPNSLASAILLLSKDEKLRERMGKRGRKLSEEQFSWKIVTKRILELVF